MRRPNKSGSISKMSGKRHKPWRARITTGYTEDGKQISKYIGSFATKKEAVLALEAYTACPELPRSMTLAEAWKGFSEADTIRKGTLISYRSAFRKCSQYHDTALEDFNLDIMQGLVDLDPHTFATSSTMKKMLAAVMEYGFAHDGCPASRRDLLKYIKLPDRPSKTAARRFTDSEIQSAIDSGCSLAVVLLFTGLRREELYSLQAEDVDYTNQIIHVRKSKTAAGIRDVPIPDRLIPWLKPLLESGDLQHSPEWISQHLWKPYPIHSLRRHDCRHTYISLLTEAGVDERMIKQLVGHAGGVTIDVYTHINDKTKLETVNKVFNEYLPNLTSSGAIYDGKADVLSA